MAFTKPQNIPGGSETDFAKERLQFRFLSSQIDVVAKSMVGGHRWPRLAGIQFPRVEVEHHRLAFFGVHMMDPTASPTNGEEPEVATASDRQVHAENTDGADRKLNQPSLPFLRIAFGNRGASGSP